MRTLMPVKTAGNKPPLFCVNGEPLKMAQFLPPDQPLYGLCDAYHPHFNPPEKIQQLAEMYVREIQLVQPQGPYYIIGFSIGGLIAWEVAHQLVERGEDIAYLGMIDPSFPEVGGTNKDWARHRADWVKNNLAEKGSRIRNIGRVVKRIGSSLAAQSHTRYRLFKVFMYETLGKELPIDLRRIRCNGPIRRSLQGFDYEPVDIGGVVFHTETLRAGSEEEYTKYWNGILTRGAEIRIMEGIKKHLEFLEDEHLSRVTDMINQDITARHS